jgi:head-tail adaptor
MNQFIDIVSPSLTKDAEGFATQGDTVIASVRAYKEDRHGNEGWANRAAFTTATALFRFRKIPDIVVDATFSIIWNGERYRITSAEDVKNRGMYTECLAERVDGSMR